MSILLSGPILNVDGMAHVGTHNMAMGTLHLFCSAGRVTSVGPGRGRATTNTVGSRATLRVDIGFHKL